MKKSTLLAVTTALALLLALPLVGCGGASGTASDSTSSEASETSASAADKLTDFIWYEAEVPEGWEVKFIDGNYANAAEFHFDPDDDAAVLKITYNNSKTAQDELASSLDFWDDHTQGDDITLGDYTWKVENFTWDDDTPSMALYTDTPDGNGNIEVTIFMSTTDNADIKAFLETLQFADDTYDAYNAAYNVEGTDIDIK